jgi:hypothetical protein
MYSKGRAQEVANKMEYHWMPEGDYARSKLADFDFYSALDFNPPLRKKVLLYEGDEYSWNAAFVVIREESLDDFANQMIGIARDRNWKKISEEKSEADIKLEWTFTNHRAELCHVIMSFATSSVPHEYLLQIDLDRV